MLPGVQEKIGGGRRARGGGEGAVPVLAVPARIADVPVYLDGVGTAKARNTGDGAAAGRWPHPQHQFQGRPGRQARRRAGHDRSGHLPGAARPGGRQEGARRVAARQRQARPRALQQARRQRRGAEDHRYAARARRPVRPRRSSSTMRPSPTPRRFSTTPPSSRPSTAAPASAWSTRATWCAPSDAGIVVITEIRPIAVLFTLPQQQLAQVNKAQASRRAERSTRSMPTARPRSTAARCRWSTTRSIRRPARCG